MKLFIDGPNEKQALFLLDKHKYIAYGGARGGGKSWAVRTKAKLMALRYPGIRLLIVRRSYPELINNHINTLRKELLGIAKYNDKDKVLRFINGSTINFTYCDRDQDLDRLQGVEYDVIFLDEATQLSEYQMKTIVACVRGVNDFPKRVYFTCNPGGQGHGYIKRLFIDRRFESGENPADYAFIQALVRDNTALMQTQPEYIRQLEALPPHLREMWLEGRWDVFAGQFFEEFRLDPDPALYKLAGVTAEEAAQQHRFTHVIAPFRIPRGWKIYRSYDFGYNKPFSLAWWAVDYDGVLYRIKELYGCTGEPNEGVRQTPDEQFRRAVEIERTDPLLAGRKIEGPGLLGHLTRRERTGDGGAVRHLLRAGGQRPDCGMDAVPLPAAVRRAGIRAVLHLRHVQGLHPDDPTADVRENEAGGRGHGAGGSLSHGGHAGSHGGRLQAD